MYGPYQVYLGGGVNPPHAPAIPLEWHCEQNRHVSIIAEVDEQALREILSYTPFEYVNNRARFALSHHKGHTLTTPEGYRESGIGVAVRYRDIVAQHYIYMHCDDTTAILAGRDVFGMPKKDAHIGFREEGDRKWGNVACDGVTLLEVDFRADESAPDVPLVEGQAVTGFIHVRRLPFVDRPGDAYADIVYRDNKVKVLERVPGRVSLKVGGSKWDPIDRLKPRVLGAVFTVTSFGGYFAQENRKILHSWTGERTDHEPANA
jgi:acetoacetate decarboxylase